jgi:hypothetical protein
MKTIFNIAICVLFGATALAQQTEVKVYSYNNGIKEVVPSQVIVKSPEKTEIFNTTNGVKNILPTTVIKPNGDIYKVENGIQQILPVQRLEIQTPSVTLPVINNTPTVWFNPFN